MPDLSANDRLAIVELYARHFSSLDGLTAITGGDADHNWANTFTPDGQFSIVRSSGELVMEVRGTKALLDAYASFPDIASTRHWTNNLVIEPDEIGARGGCYIIALNIAVSPSTIIRTGLYEDRLVRVSAEWRFQSRKLILDANSPAA